jgi:hypothetical protein
MLSREAVEHYRRMSPRERIAEMKELLDVADRALRRLPRGEAARRLAAADRIHNESKSALLDALLRLETPRGSADRS